MADAKFFEPYWTWQSKSNDLCTVHMRMEGRASVADLLAHMAEVAPGVPPEDLMLDFATVTWSRPATAEELAERAAWAAKAQERHAAWERRMVAELSEKYGLVPRTSWEAPTMKETDHE